MAETLIGTDDTRYLGCQELYRFPKNRGVHRNMTRNLREKTGDPKISADCAVGTSNKGVSNFILKEKLKSNAIWNLHSFLFHGRNNSMSVECEAEKEGTESAPKSIKIVVFFLPAREEITEG